MAAADDVTVVVVDCLVVVDREGLEAGLSNIANTSSDVILESDSIEIVDYKHYHTNIATAIVPLRI